jgi:hypothetical protein
MRRDIPPRIAMVMSTNATAIPAPTSNQSVPGVLPTWKLASVRAP